MTAPLALRQHSRVPLTMTVEASRRSAACRATPISCAKMLDWNDTGNELAAAIASSRSVEAIHARHRPEHFFARHLGIGGRVEQHGGAVGRLRQPLAAGQQPGAALDRLVDPGGDPVDLARLDQRPHLRLRQQRIADLERPHMGHEALQESRLDIGMDEDALGRDADLAGMVIAALDHRINDPVEIGAAVDDGRRRAAMFERRARAMRQLAAQMTSRRGPSR